MADENVTHGSEDKRAPSAIEAALRAIISEVTPGYRPFPSSDSYLPAHLVDAARAALAGNNMGGAAHV